MVKTEVATTSPSGKLVIYTGRDEEMVQNVIDQFNEKYPDIEVEFLTMGAQQILERLRERKPILKQIFGGAEPNQRSLLAPMKTYYMLGGRALLTLLIPHTKMLKDDGSARCCYQK